MKDLNTLTRIKKYIFYYKNKKLYKKQTLILETQSYEQTLYDENTSLPKEGLYRDSKTDFTPISYEIYQDRFAMKSIPLKKDLPDSRTYLFDQNNIDKDSKVFFSFITIPITKPCIISKTDHSMIFLNGKKEVINYFEALNDQTIYFDDILYHTEGVIRKSGTVERHQYEYILGNTDFNDGSNKVPMIDYRIFDELYEPTIKDIDDYRYDKVYYKDLYIGDDRLAIMTREVYIEKESQ